MSQVPVVNNTQIKPEDIKAIECRFAVYGKPKNGESDDYHFVKEVVHTHSGQKIPRLKIIKNFERPFYVTRKSYQNHKDKKEWELIERVQEYKTTQSQLILKASRALGEPYFNGNLRKLARSPYLYGADILSTAVIKQEYSEKYPDTITPFEVASFDTETDVVHGTEEVIMATLSYKERVFTSISKDFLKGCGPNIPERLQVLLDKYLSEYVQKRNIKWEIKICDDDIGCITSCFDKAHEWKPDFVAIWNMNFDIPKVVESLVKKGIDPEDVFSDPKIPKAYRFFEYKQGPNQKVTASGKVTPIKPAAQWHTVFCPSSFYVIDAMCAYRHIRTGSPEEASYSLDAILNKVLGIRKLKFEQANHVSGLKWHYLMQTEYKLEYVIYNVFDCVSMEELDEKTKDLCLTFPSMAGISDFANFKSQPRRVVDQLHYYCLKQGRVIGTTSDEMTNDLDKLTIGLRNWIIMLPAHLVADNGLRIIEESPDLSTNIRCHIGDLDVAASYPNGGAVFNISKETTRKELVEIEGISEYTRRMQGINLSAGQTNAVEVCVGLFNMPTLDTLLEAFVIDQNLPVEDLELGVVKYITAIIPSESNLVKDTSEKEDDEAPASAS